MQSTEQLRMLKQELRKQAHANRRDQPDKEGVSRAICRRFATLPEYRAAPTVMLYVHVRTEVRTQEFLPEAIAEGKRVVVPYCVGDELELFVLENMDELAIGTYGILEPRMELRALPAKRIDVAQVDLVMVPGVAFDRQGGRMGHGKGYYDRLLRYARPQTPLIAAAFECQLFPHIPMSEHDIFMDQIVTEKAVYQGRGREERRRGARGTRRTDTVTRAQIDDTYAEAFKSIYAPVLITARDRTWLEHAVRAATGNASSTILCDCEAGLDRYVGPGLDEAFPTPDGRPGALVQFHVPRFRKDRVAILERALLVRLSQNVLTCPTTACFSPLQEEPYFKLGRKIAFFGDGYQFRDERFGRRVWVVPILGGEFVLDRRFGYRDGLMGGNLWFMGQTLDAALSAERALAAAAQIPGVIAPFPGGVTWSGSKAGSRYSFTVASTYAKYCPTLRERLGEQSGVPQGVQAIMEIILNGCDLATISRATQAALDASADTPGLLRISAGNYGGRLGKDFIYLRP